MNNNVFIKNVSDEGIIYRAREIQLKIRKSIFKKIDDASDEQILLRANEIIEELEENIKNNKALLERYRRMYNDTN